MSDIRVATVNSPERLPTPVFCPGIRQGTKNDLPDSLHRVDSSSTLASETHDD